MYGHNNYHQRTGQKVKILNMPRYANLTKLDSNEAEY